MIDINHRTDIKVAGLGSKDKPEGTRGKPNFFGGIHGYSLIEIYDYDLLIKMCEVLPTPRCLLVFTYCIDVFCSSINFLIFSISRAIYIANACFQCKL